MSCSEMNGDSNSSSSLEANESDTASSADSLSESEQDTSDSLGNLNIQTAANKRTCSDGDLDSDEEQAPKLRCIRKDDGNSSNNNTNYNSNGDQGSSSNIGYKAGTCSNSQDVKQDNNYNVNNLGNCDTSVEVDNAQCLYDYPYKSHLNSNHTCAAELDTDSKRLHINCLPHMLMTRIFSYLPLPDLLRRASLVCQYWRNISYDPVLWRSISLNIHPKISDETLLGLVQLSQNVNLLDITDAKFVTSKGMIKVFEHCTFMTTLKLVRVQLNTECLSSIGYNCQRIKKLHLDSCYSLNDDALQEIAEGCGDYLQELRLNYCRKICYRGITAVSSHCHNLRHLMLCQCQQVTDRCMENLVSGCANLETLMLMNCGLTDDGVIKLAQLQRLKVLDLSNIAAVTPRSVTAIVKSCKYLESLNLALCRKINDECVHYIARTATNLKYLHMVSCNLTDKALQHIADHSKTIESLEVSWCQELTLEGVIKVSTGCEKTLTYLGLVRCDKIEPSEMDELVERFPTIRYSTWYLDCGRLLERARKEGHLSKHQNLT